MAAFYAVLERISAKEEQYRYQETERHILEEQKKYEFAFPCKFSIRVPAYETKETYLKELIDSVLSQTYGNFELIIADAGTSSKVERTVSAYSDKRIRYFRLKNNGGIAENTNEALKRACGDYIGLLDHDDFLTPDALFEMAKAIENKKKTGEEAGLLYSDEDKCDSGGERFFEPHRKTDFNLELLLSNNYICHFLVMKAELMKELTLRKDYDGAQDYDLILRAAGRLIREYGYLRAGEKICHIPKILYHWRCHEASTAVNPQSKQYAYTAGEKAVGSFLEEMGWRGKVLPTEHLGFYTIITDDILSGWGKVAGIGGEVIDGRNRVKAGIYERNGNVLFRNLPVHFSGPMHRAALRQTAYALDLRCIRIAPDCVSLFERTTGMKYKETSRTSLFWWNRYQKNDEEWKNVSMAFGKAAAENGYRLVFDPDCICKVNRHGELKWQRRRL